MRWVLFVTVHGIRYEVEDLPQHQCKVYKFKKEEKELTYVMPYTVIRGHHPRDIETELLGVLKEVFNEYN